jgi:hypothetical protein
VRKHTNDASAFPERNKEGRLVMERTREELQYEDLVKIYIDYMKSEPLKN